MSPIRAIHLPRAAAALAIGVLATAVAFGSSPAGAAQVGLGTADSFAVLAGAGITNTGPTTITGDVGSFPTVDQTGFGSVTLTGTSTNHHGDSVTQGAKTDLVTAYNDAAGRLPETAIAVELGGSTLLAGNYTSGTFGLTGTLTLDAQGNTDAQFVFKAESTLITAADSRVLLINGADPCRVVWQVGSSATFNTRTAFVGDVLALTDISALTGATFQGRLLARNGAVTLDTNTITRANCVVPAGGGTTTTTAAAGGSTTSTTVASGGSTTSTTIAAGGSGGTTTSTTVGVVGTTPTTVAVVGTTPTTLAPGGSSAGTTGLSTASLPGTPAATPAAPVTPGAPATPATPGAPATPVVPGAPATPTPGQPSLPVTGSNVAPLVGLGVLLTLLGAATVVAGRSIRTPQR